MKLFFWSLLLTIGAIGSVVAASTEIPEKVDCPEIWAEYVAIVQGVLASHENETLPVLFVGTGGQVHNCLVEQIDPHLLDQVSSFHFSISHLYSGDLNGPPAAWPENVCAVGNVQNPAFSYITIDLPYALNVLAGEICRKRILKSLTHFLEYPKGD